MAKIQSTYDGLKELLEQLKLEVENGKFSQRNLMGYVSYLRVDGKISKSGYRKLFEFLRENYKENDKSTVEKQVALKFLTDYLELL